MVICDMARGGNINVEPIRMPVRTPEKQAAIVAKREKRRQKREGERQQAQSRRNFNFDDSEQLKECGVCGKMQTDVYPARIVGLPEYRTRIGGNMVKEICPRCETILLDQGARLERRGLEDFGKPSTGNVYDNKPGHRIG